MMLIVPPFGADFCDAIVMMDLREEAKGHTSCVPCDVVLHVKGPYMCAIQCGGEDDVRSVRSGHLACLPVCFLQEGLTETGR